MVNSIIALDNEDGSLGLFFDICKNMVANAIDSVSNGTWTYVEIPTKSLNEVNIELKTTMFKGSNFIFNSFTHGNDDALFSNGNPIIYSPCQPNYLSNSMAFCFACCSGKTLGIDLISTGTLCFLGYNKEVSVWSTYLQIFAECATESIIAFYNGNTVRESLNLKIQKHNLEIDNIYTKNFPVAALLMENRDAIVLHGNDNLTIREFINK